MLENSILVPVGESVGWRAGRCRFLGVDRAGSAVLIPMQKHTQGPRTVSIDEIENAIEDGTLEVEQAKQPSLLPDDLTPKARAHYDFWQLHFAPLLRGEERDQLLEAEVRVEIQHRLTLSTGKPALAVRRALYRVLRAGRSLSGLAPNFRARGGPGKPQPKKTAKRGRKPQPGSITSGVALPGVRPILEAAVRKRVIQLKESVPTAFHKMIAENFTETIVHPSGLVTRKKYEEARLPTLRQFQRVAQVLQDERPRAPRKDGRRARPGTAKDAVPGPGYRYEIDATGGRLELVSEFDVGQPIGSANAYGVLDVWSTACVGGCMGVFTASYRAAQVALFNTFTSKKDLCARWDIDIPEDAWPCAHLPRFIASDRGELVSDASEALPMELNVVALTAAAYRPDMKGTVERWFCDLKAGDVRKLVGFGRKEHRGETNPKAQAALTRYDAMRAFLLLALRYNHQPAPIEAIPPEMLEQGYEHISRITLWQWGMQNLVSGARTEDPGVIYTSLLRKVEASVRENGLFVENVRYMSPELRASGLLQRAAQSGAIAVQATVDDFAANMVWYRTAIGAPWLPAHLADEKLKHYNATFFELADYYRRRRIVHQRSRINSATFDYSTGESLAAISRDAVARQKGEKKKPKNAVRVRAARAVDAQDERREHGSQVMQSYQDAAKPQKSVQSHSKVDQARAVRLRLARTAFLETGS